MASEIPGAVKTATRIAAGDDRTRYDGVAIALHWTTVLLVMLQFALAELWGYAAKPTRQLMVTSHMSFGIVLTAVILARIVWRLIPGHQVRSAVLGWVEIASRAVHYLLYALLMSQAVLGFLLRWSGNEAMSLFGLQIPSPIAPWSKPAHHLVGELHNYVGWTIIVVALGHASAALFHHYYLRDNVLRRMLREGA